MNDKNNVNVVVIARFEENEKDFIELLNSKPNNQINFSYISENDLLQKVKKSIESSDRIILLVDSIDGVTSKMSDIIEEIANYHVIPIVALNGISNEESLPDTTIDEIGHVLIMHNVTDEQLEFPVVYIDEENRYATLSLEKKENDFNALYDVILNK